jgi:flagellar motor switch protein FliN
MSSTIDTKQLSAVGEIFDFFIASATDAIKINFPDIAGKNFHFSTGHIEGIEDLGKFKDRQLIVSKLNYNIYGEKNPLFVLSPREIAAQCADMLTGGDGTGVDPQSLTEVQINAYGGLIASLLESLERFFADAYEEYNIKLDIAKSYAINTPEKYDEIFDNTEPKLCVELSIVLGKKNKYQLYIVVQESHILKSLKHLKLVDEDVSGGVVNLENIGRISDIWVKLEVRLGDAKIPLKRVLELDSGSIIELTTAENADVGVLVDNVEIAKAQIVAVEGNFGIKITKILEKNILRK